MTNQEPKKREIFNRCMRVVNQPGFEGRLRDVLPEGAGWRINLIPQPCELVIRCKMVCCLTRGTSPTSMSLGDGVQLIIGISCDVQLDSDPEAFMDGLKASIAQAMLEHQSQVAWLDEAIGQMMDEFHQERCSYA